MNSIPWVRCASVLFVGGGLEITNIFELPTCKARPQKEKPGYRGLVPGSCGTVTKKINSLQSAGRHTCLQTL